MQSFGGCVLLLQSTGLTVWMQMAPVLSQSGDQSWQVELQQEPNVFKLIKTRQRETPEPCY